MNFPYRRSNRECPECSGRLEVQSGPDFVSHYQCPECEWRRTYDTHEQPTDLGWVGGPGK